MTQQKTNADIVLEAIKDLHNQEQIVTRETLSEATGLQMTIIDDRVGHLIDKGLVNRVQRGVFVPVSTFAAARHITRSLLPDGGSVLEVGDIVLQLSPREARMLGELMAGSGAQYAAIELGRVATEGMAEMSRRVTALQKKLQLRKQGSEE